MSFGYPIPVRFLTPLVVLYVWVQAAFPDIERRVYWGEFLVLLLLPSIVRAKYRHPCQGKTIRMVYFMLFVIPVFSVLYTLTFWNDEYDSYFLLRHLAMFHYIIFFFFAYRYADRLLVTMARFFWVPLLFLIPVIGLSSVGHSLPLGLSISAIGGTVLLSWLYLGYVKRCESYRSALMGFAVLIALIALLDPRSTNIAIVVVLLLLVPFVRLLKYWHRLVPLPMRRLLVFTGAAVCVAGLWLVLGFLGREIHENVALEIKMLRIPELAGADFGEFEGTRAFTSALWRASYWGYLLYRLSEHPFGLGLGTPMFEHGLENVMAVGRLDTVTVEYQAFTMGAHNSFITLLVRVGMIFLIPLIVSGLAVIKMISRYWRTCSYRPLSSREGRVVFGSIVAFIVVVIQAMFNVVIETPLYAALFWFSFGLMTRLVGDFVVAIDDRGQTSGYEQWAVMGVATPDPIR